MKMARFVSHLHLVGRAVPKNIDGKPTIHQPRRAPRHVPGRPRPWPTYERPEHTIPYYTKNATSHVRRYKLRELKPTDTTIHIIIPVEWLFNSPVESAAYGATSTLAYVTCDLLSDCDSFLP